MKIMVIGNEGYVGPLVVKRLKQYNTKSIISGFDTGYFAHVITDVDEFPEKYIDIQYRGDVRKFPVHILKDYDAVVYLAAISNDPMGKEFESVTYDVNQHSAVKIAKACKEFGIHHFVYASSCSVYGSADDKPRTEESDVNPLTAYAKSKVETEKELRPLASKNFIITCLRFATACGFSPRVRLDLVLNDFVACAMMKGIIEILSDGTPWRPLIHVKDMARSIDWAVHRKESKGTPFLTINAGSNVWNYRIVDLGKSVKKVIQNVELSVNTDAEPDNRSYTVDFTKFEELSGQYKPKITIDEAIYDIYEGLNKMEFLDKNFRSSQLIRLNVLRNHINNNRLNDKLFWTK